MLEKILKNIYSIALIVILTVALVFVFSAYKACKVGDKLAEQKAAFNKTLAEKESKIQDLETIEVAAKESAKKYKDAADQEAAKRKADNEAWEKKAKADNEAWLKRVAVMTADAVVEDTRARLKLTETDVYKNSFGIQFTLAGAKTNLIKIASADFFSLTREPKLLADIASLGKENIDLRKSNDEQGTALKACDEIKAENLEIKANYADILKKTERQATWLKITIPVGGLAILGSALYLWSKLKLKK